MESEDRPALDALCKASFTRLYAHFARGGFDTSRVLVARGSGGPVGFVQVRSILRGKVANVYFIAVDPASRGRGIGRRLLDRALEVAWTSGHEYAMASVPRRNRPSLGLFTGADFRPMRFGRLRVIFGLAGALGLYWEALVAPHERVMILPR